MYCMIIFSFFIFIKLVTSSIGDQSPYYERCLDKCNFGTCSRDGINFKKKSQPLMLYITGWTCKDECKYDCMWKTVGAFEENSWGTPQFYGKWPFIRILGMQEPASVVFSILNGLVHLKMIFKFKREVRPDSPLVWLWYSNSIICIHAWFWSAVFHARDLWITEVLDYSCAFSMVLMCCYVMLIRLLRNKVPLFVLLMVTLFVVAFLINHVSYLSMSNIDYAFNMELNIMIGTFTAICWFAWCIHNWMKQPYVWKCAFFIALTGIVMLLEVIDRPPFFYIFDFHSLWHLSTIPLPILFYSFAIDDCRYLRELEKEAKTDVNKKIP